MIICFRRLSGMRFPFQVACAVVLALSLLHPFVHAADADWHAFEPSNQGVFAVNGGSDDLIAGGIFTALGGVALPNVGRWDGQAWSPLGSGPGYAVGALVRDGATIYAMWSNSHISRWNGTDWTEIGVANGSLYDLAMMGGKLYVSGFSTFTQMSGVAVQGIACWDGATWASVGGGVNGAIWHMSATSSAVYITGSFTTAGGSPALGGVASWNGSAWTGYPAGSGVSGGFAVLKTDSGLYVGRDTVARWTGSAWAVLGTADNSVRAMKMLDGKLYIGGDFTHINGIAANHLAVWNGSVWSAIGSGADDEVNRMSVAAGNLVIAGNFTTVGGNTAHRIAMLDLTKDLGAPSEPIDGDAASSVLLPTVAIGTHLNITASSAYPAPTGVAYRLRGDAGGKIAINAQTGVVTAAQALSLGVYTIGIQAGAGFHFSAVSSFTIQVDHRPATPVDADATTNRVSPTAAIGSLVGITAQANDLDGTALSYSLFSDAGGRFAINTTTGVVRVAAALGSPAVSQIGVRADDGILTSDAIFTITIDDPPSVPSDIDATANQIIENARIGRSVGLTVSSTDPNGSAVTYSLSDNSGGRFVIGAATGIVTVAASLGAPAARSITVVASDGLLSTSANFTIAITANQAPSAPIDVDTAASSISLLAAIGTPVHITAGSTDPDGNAVIYSLSDDAGGRFAINATTGVVTVASTLGAAGTRSITIVASDGVLSASAVFAVTVVNQAPSAPIDADTATDTVSASAPIATAVRITASSTDPDGGAVTYSLSDNASGRFAINGTTGVVTVAAALGDPGSRSITVVASDGMLSTSAVFTINVVNQVPTEPSDVNPAVDAVVLSAAAGTPVGITARSTDADSGAVLAYRLTDSAGGLFAIDPSTGVVSVAAALGAVATHRITVKATDGWADASANFDIVVTAVMPAAASPGGDGGGGGGGGGGCGVGAIGSIGLALALGLRGRRNKC